jgi:hypothetical protein
MRAPHAGRSHVPWAAGKLIAALSIPGLAIAWMIAPAAADEPDAGAVSPDASASVRGEPEAATPADAAAPRAAQPEAGTPAEAAVPEGGLGDGQGPAAANADGGEQELTWDHRFSFGVRAQYALPFGDAVAGQSGGEQLNNVVSGVFLIGGEVGYLVYPRLTLLGYFFYGFPTFYGGAASTCAPTEDTGGACSASLIRFGVMANYHFSANKRWDPWIGAGIGYEILNLEADDCTGTATQTFGLNGFELTGMGGVELRPGANLGLGPYVELSGGHYFADISSSAIHGWVSLGLRLRTGP